MARPSVLIVEDEREIAELMQFNLKRAGFDTDVAHRGREALDRIRKTPPDVVVLDLMLPDLDGLEICRRIRANDENSSTMRRRSPTWRMIVLVRLAKVSGSSRICRAYLRCSRSADSVAISF